MMINGEIMSMDRVVAVVRDDRVTEIDEQLAPLWFRRGGDVRGWLEHRAIDTHRTNSRLLKKVLRLTTADDADVVLSVHAATITDTYWFRPAGSNLSYKDVCFTENQFDKLALSGDPNSFNLPTSRTPELTNVGSYEKCWRLIDGRWWIYKTASDFELFSEIFISRLGNAMGFSMAQYEADAGYVRSPDFTDGAAVNFESMRSLMGEDEDYTNNFNCLYALSPALSFDYLRLIYMDTLCFNMDRHTGNYGLLRDVQTGQILRMAPNYDNNIALISRGYPRDVERQSDRLISLFHEFLEKCPNAKQIYESLMIPPVTEEMLDDAMRGIPVEVDKDRVKQFILNGQRRIGHAEDQADRIQEEQKQAPPFRRGRSV